MKLHELKNHWKTIRVELDALPDYTDPRWISEHGSPGFFKWVLWDDNAPAPGNMCPQTVNLLQNLHEDIEIGGFSVFLGGSGLSIHTDTDNNSANYKCTYHLGIRCPDKCYLHHSKDGIIYEKNGKDLMMDNRYPHYAKNESRKDRTILYMELNHDRPNILTRVKRLFN
jgi:aspartyl/asparaginyl beta-hydroxylase (cupin superfamily)